MVATYQNEVPINTKRLRVGFLDTSDDSVAYVESTECGGTDAVQTADGGIYASINSFSTSTDRVGLPDSFAPCMVRIAPGADDFDENYVVNPSEMTGVRLTASISAGEGTTGDVVAYDETLLPIASDAGIRDIQFAPAWRVYEIPDLNDQAPGSATLVDGIPPAAAFIFFLTIDGRAHLATPGADFASTFFFELGGERPVEEFAPPGIVFFTERL